MDKNYKKVTDLGYHVDIQHDGVVVIYSDDKIVEGDWVLAINGDFFHLKKISDLLGSDKKLIATTTRLNGPPKLVFHNDIIEKFNDLFKNTISSVPSMDEYTRGKLSGISDCINIYKEYYKLDTTNKELYIEMSTDCCGRCDGIDDKCTGTETFNIKEGNIINVRWK